MNDKVKKFENPERLKELSPKETLKKIGFKDDMCLCDIGAGTGIFSVEASKISKNDVYALDISQDMIDILNIKKSDENLVNMKVIRVETDTLPIKDNICNIAIMITVMHELENIEIMMNEIKRILKDGGKLFIVEFHKKKTPFGPPEDHRMSIEQVTKICEETGFRVEKSFDLGENFYGISVFV